MSPVVGEKGATPQVEVREKEGARGYAGPSDRAGHRDVRALHRGHSGKSPGVLSELQPQTHHLVRQEGESPPRRALRHQDFERVSLVVDRHDEVVLLRGLPHVPDQSDHGGGPVGGAELLDRPEVLETRAPLQKARERSESGVEEGRVGEERCVAYGRSRVPVLDQTERQDGGAGRRRAGVARSGDRRPRPRNGRAALREDRFHHLPGHERADRVRALDHLPGYDEGVRVVEEELESSRFHELLMLLEVGDEMFPKTARHRAPAGKRGLGATAPGPGDARRARRRSGLFQVS